MVHDRRWTVFFNVQVTVCVEFLMAYHIKDRKIARSQRKLTYPSISGNGMDQHSL